MNPNPDFMPLIASDPKLSEGFKPNTDLKTGQRVIDMLCNAGVHAEADTNFSWMIDTQIALVGMFGVKTPPITIISQNAYWDPFFHSQLGQILRPLRNERYLIIGSGGGTHNLYRTEWKYSLGWKDVFAMESPPDDKTLEFRQSLEDVFCKNGAGPKLRRGLARLMKHPYFRDAHGTDEHYVSACFAAGAVGELEDEGTKTVLGAEVWELVRAASTSNLLRADLVSSAPSVSSSMLLGNGQPRGGLQRQTVNDESMYILLIVPRVLLFFLLSVNK
jgi:aromatic ring-opening dioxygenase catalytic subunit (LigB family)